MKRMLALLLALSVLLAAVPAGARARHRTIYDAPFPQTIKVAVRESRPGGEPNPRGRILYVKTVPFDEYVMSALPGEWMPSWHENALKAGAIAVKMFAWYRVLNPIRLDGWEFHVDNTANFLAYREGIRFRRTDEAYLSTRNLAFTAPDGTIVELSFRAGHRDSPNWPYRSAQMMAQWGSQYWAEQGRNAEEILQWYYPGRSLLRIPNL